jgi:hypothetical protein
MVFSVNPTAQKTFATFQQAAMGSATTPDTAGGYRELVGSLMHIAIGTHPNIAFAVSKLTTFLNCFHPEPFISFAGKRLLKFDVTVRRDHGSK